MPRIVVLPLRPSGMRYTGFRTEKDRSPVAGPERSGKQGERVRPVLGTTTSTTATRTGTTGTTATTNGHLQFAREGDGFRCLISTTFKRAGPVRQTPPEDRVLHPLRGRFHPAPPRPGTIAAMEKRNRRFSGKPSENPTESSADQNQAGLQRHGFSGIYRKAVPPLHPQAHGCEVPGFASAQGRTHGEDERSKAHHSFLPSTAPGTFFHRQLLSRPFFPRLVQPAFALHCTRPSFSARPFRLPGTQGDPVLESKFQAEKPVHPVPVFPSPVSRACRIPGRMLPGTIQPRRRMGVGEKVHETNLSEKRLLRPLRRAYPRRREFHPKRFRQTVAFRDANGPGPRTRGGEDRFPNRLSITLIFLARFRTPRHCGKRR